jgi:hypothetical protein
MPFFVKCTLQHGCHTTLIFDDQDSHGTTISKAGRHCELRFSNISGSLGTFLPESIGGQGAPINGAGQIVTTTTPSRQIQLGVKLVW